MTSIPGPYWVRTNIDGSHDVCGRRATVIRSYPENGDALATADCRRLQKGHVRVTTRITDAAPTMLAALEMIDTICAGGESDPTAMARMLSEIATLTEVALVKAHGQ